MEKERNYEERPFRDLYIQGKPESSGDLISGKPYPEDFGTTVEKVRGFINEYWDKRDEKPVLWLLIGSILIGAIILGLLFHFFYEEAIITILFGSLGGFLGYTMYMTIFRQKKDIALYDWQLYAPEGIYLAALDLWQNKDKRKRIIGKIRKNRTA